MVEKRGNHRFEKRMHWYFILLYFFLGDVWAWMPGSFLLLLPVCFVLFHFFAAGKSGDDHFAATTRKHGMKEKDKWIRDSSRGIA